MSNSTQHAAPENDPFLEELDARTRALAAEVVQAAHDMAAAQAETAAILAASEEADSANAATVQGKSPHPKPARAMSGNVRFCPVSKRNALPKPPPSPEDPTEMELIVAAEDTRLSPAQRIAIAALVCGQTAIVAARRAGVTPRTIHRWRQEPAFSETLDRLGDDTMDAASRRVRNLLLRGTHVIADALHGSDQYRWAMRVESSSQVWKMGRREQAS